MNTKVAVGALAAALLISGLLVGVSRGGSTGITEPTVLELKWTTDAATSRIHYFPLRDGEGGGQITIKKLVLYDLDGNEVGRQHIECLSAEKNWMCTFVSKIIDGPNTDKGTVVGVGAKPLKKVQTKVNVAITGGTGAYEGVSGYAKELGGTGKTTYTLYMTP